MFRSKIDKIGIRIKKNQLKKSNSIIYNSHIHVKTYYDEILITVSSKCFLEYNKFPEICIHNISKYAEIISNSTGYIIPTNVLLNAPLFWIDMKIDCANITGVSNEKFISILREKSYKSTNKNETPSYEKEKGFKNSLLIRSTCKTIKDSFCVYDKIAEIKANKWKDSEYFNNFSEDYLIEHDNFLRFERRLQSSKDIKKAFNLQNNKSVTLFNIFSNNQNVVADKIQQLFLSEETILDENTNIHKSKQNNDKKDLSTYLKFRGIEAILLTCGNSLINFRNHLKCVIPGISNPCLYNTQQQAKKVLEDRLLSYKTVAIAVEEFLETNFGGNNIE